MTIITANIISISMVDGWSKEIALVELDSPDIESEDDDGNAVLLRTSATISNARLLASFILGPELELRVVNGQIQDWKVLDG